MRRRYWLHICPSIFRCASHRVEGPYYTWLSAWIRGFLCNMDNPYSEALILKSDTKPRPRGGRCWAVR